MDIRQTPRSPAKRSTPHLCSHKMHSLRSFSMLKSITCLLVPSSLDGGFRCHSVTRCQVSGVRKKTKKLQPVGAKRKSRLQRSGSGKPDTSVFVICIFYSFNTSPSLLAKIFNLVPVYSRLFPGYTIKRVGFGKSPYGPYPIETSLDLPHPCGAAGVGHFFYSNKIKNPSGAYQRGVSSVEVR